MNKATAEIDIPVAHPQPANTNLGQPAYLLLFECVALVFTAASTTIRGGVVTPFRHLWAHYYRRVVFGGEGVAMTHSAIFFIIKALLAFAAIKSQCLAGFPFQTHPLTIIFSVTSLLVYGLASAAEVVNSAAGFDPTSVYAITAHLGKIVSLCVMVVSLASLFYI